MKYWLKLLLWTVIAFLCKTLMDVSKFRWLRSWLSEVDFFNWWRNLPAPLDMYHILYGIIITFPAAYLLFKWFNGTRWFMKWKKYEQGTPFWKKTRWSSINYILYGLAVLLWWLLFYEGFRYMYHHFLMYSQYKDLFK